MPKSMTEEGKQMKPFVVDLANTLITDLVHQLSQIRKWDTDTIGVFNTFEAVLNFSDMKDSKVLLDAMFWKLVGFGPFWNPTAMLEMISKSISKVFGPEKIAVEDSVLRETCRLGSELYKKIVNQLAIDFSIEFKQRMVGISGLKLYRRRTFWAPN